jgi:predicted  nucleic acid-binding Zn-ribbon protein
VTAGISVTPGNSETSVNDMEARIELQDRQIEDLEDEIRKLAERDEEKQKLLDELLEDNDDIRQRMDELLAKLERRKKFCVSLQADNVQLLERIIALEKKMGME